VHIVLRGHAERTREIQLVNPQRPRSFKPNSTDTFPISAADVGVIKGVDVHIEGTGGRSWRLKHVLIKTPRMVKSKKPPYFVHQEFKCVAPPGRRGLLHDGDDPTSVEAKEAVGHMLDEDKDEEEDYDDDEESPGGKGGCCFGGCCVCTACSCSYTLYSCTIL
jgi:hypothetical protein